MGVGSDILLGQRVLGLVFNGATWRRYRDWSPLRTSVGEGRIVDLDANAEHSKATRWLSLDWSWPQRRKVIIRVEFSESCPVPGPEISLRSSNEADRMRSGVPILNIVGQKTMQAMIFTQLHKDINILNKATPFAC